MKFVPGQRIAGEIAEVRKLGIEVAIVIGGGNIFRGAGLARAGMDRVTGDYMGMLATVMNALAIQDALESLNVFARVMSAIQIHEVCEDYIRRRGYVVFVDAKRVSRGDMHGDISCQFGVATGH